MALPPELIDVILRYLSPVDLAKVAQTCHGLRSHAISDVQWLPRVQEYVPGVILTTPTPCLSYRELYVAHDPRWFLTKYKIWFCDRHLMGKMIVVRYDQRRGCIEGYQLLANVKPAPPHQWPADGQVTIHSFEPRVRLHLDKPVLQFRVGDGDDHSPFEEVPADANRRFFGETRMRLDNNADHIFCNFSLAKPLEPSVVEKRFALRFPYEGAWPPRAIPAAPHRVHGFANSDENHDLTVADRPFSREEASDRTFRIRQWMEMVGTNPAPGAMLGEGMTGMMHALLTAGFMPVGWEPGTTALPPLNGFNAPRIGEEIITYSTVDPTLYTPTEWKPWRGIWVGDYSGHGCEFLLVHQPDTPDDEASDEELGLIQRPDEPSETWEERRRRGRIYRGRLEAIKLTGDPNVPRGEHTFIAEDLSDAGLVATLEDPPFQGARVVKSKGHVAGTAFSGGKHMIPPSCRQVTLLTVWV